MASVNSTGLPIRVKLRRQYEIEETIQKNLQNLKMRSFKKKYAQRKYYGISTKTENSNKVPVHARLGMRRINLRRGAYSFISNGFVHKRLSQRRNKIRIRNQGGILNQNRLRLRRIHDNSGPINFTVALPSRNNFSRPCRHSCMAELNPTLQNEINVIQAENCNTPEIIPPVAIFTPGYGCTAISLSLRFTK